MNKYQVSNDQETWVDCPSGPSRPSIYLYHRWVDEKGATLKNDVDELIRRGAIQRSRKYRKVFVPPAPSCLEWLRGNDPDVYDRMVEEALRRLEGEAMNFACVMRSDLTEIELTPIRVRRVPGEDHR